MPDKHADQRAEHEYPEVADSIGRQLGAQPARPGDEVRLLGEDGSNHALQLERLVLPVGVDRGDQPGAPCARQPVAESQHGPLAPVNGHVAHERARRGGP